MQDPDEFGRSLSNTCASLPASLHYSEECNDFLMTQFLVVDSSQRASLKTARKHVWLRGLMDTDADHRLSLPDITIPGEIQKISPRKTGITLRSINTNLLSIPSTRDPPKTPCVKDAKRMLVLRDGYDSDDDFSPRADVPPDDSMKHEPDTKVESPRSGFRRERISPRGTTLPAVMTVTVPASGVEVDTARSQLSNRTPASLPAIGPTTTTNNATPTELNAGTTSVTATTYPTHFKEALDGETVGGRMSEMNIHT